MSATIHDGNDASIETKTTDETRLFTWICLTLLLTAPLGLTGSEGAGSSGQEFHWIETENFDQYGGWVLDTQYVHLMGSAYLIASGIGKPVEDAITKVPVSRAGRYQVWVRARNWLPPH